MLNFFRSINTIISLLPFYLLFLIIFLIIIPTIVTIIFRFHLYKHLSFLLIKIRQAMTGSKIEPIPSIITEAELRARQAHGNWEKVNILALIEEIYSQEKFVFLGRSWHCESINYFSRNLPNLLLAFGLLGTFLGITINLASISQTINQVEINDIRSLVGELNTPLQGMGIAFVSSLIAVVCSALLNIINFYWQTSLTKNNLISALEDYLDNIYLPQLPSRNLMAEGVEHLVTEFKEFLGQFGNTVERAIATSLVKPMEQMAAENQKTSALAQQVYSGIVNSSQVMEQGATSFRKSANIIDRSKFADKLTSATSDLAIAQNQFSQSSLLFKKATQSLETTLSTIEESAQKMTDIGEEISQLNKKYLEIMQLNQQQIKEDKQGLQEVSQQITKLVEKIEETSS